MQFKEFTLDRFQEEAIEYVNQNYSVIVSAATGTGKTLIADYVIDKYLQEGRRIIYTAPIKALSNQKFRDFTESYGEGNIGLMTGDIVINPDAPVLIMTTEIYRNMLLTRDEVIDKVSYVIFDEIHFINDIERGTIWEESIIFSPQHVRFLCLSATIPNAEEFGAWIETIKKHKVKIVNYMKRAVPLEHFVFDKVEGIKPVKEFREVMEIPDYDYIRGKQRERKKQLPTPFPEELIGQIRDRLPCLFFVFSRIECEKKAVFLGRRFSFLQEKDKTEIARLSAEIIPPDYRSMESVRRLKEVLPKGIGFHHAGMLPYSKELVEKLFARGLIKVLFATETFAVGINMPAKSVAFNSLYKYDGVHFRYMTSKEYFQMAGRAGRRGIDKIGFVYILFNRREDSIDKIRQMTEKDDEPIRSQFRLSINTVLNIVNNFDSSMWETLLKSSFDFFQKKQEHGHVRIMASFNNKLKNLEKLGYIRNGKLTEKGLFARKIYDQELLVTELFFSDLYKKMSDTDLAVLAASIVYEPGKADWFDKKNRHEARELISTLSKKTELGKELNSEAIKRLYTIVSLFINGEDFEDVMKATNIQEGDAIRLFRRGIDLLRQVRHATSDYELMDRAGLIMHKLERLPVKVIF